MKRRWLAVAGLLTLLVGCASLFQAGAQSEKNARSGAEIFHQCLLCHSNVELARRGPQIEGLPAWYLVQQLNKFKSGIRGTNADNRSEALMGSIFQAVPMLTNDAEIKTIADYIASLPPLLHPKVIRGDATLGKVLYQQSCVVCHGDKAQGNEAQKAPPLNVQEDLYLFRWLTQIKSGDRGENPDDVEARLMRAAIGGVDATNFTHIVRYLADELARTNATDSPAATRGQP